MFESGNYRQTTLAPIDQWTETGDHRSETRDQWSETGLWNHSYTRPFTSSQNRSQTVVASLPSKSGQLIFLIFLFVFIVIGNLSVLLALGLSKRDKKSFRMNYFIMNLALADLLVALVSVLTDIIWKITLHWYAGDVICKTVRYLQAVVTYASTYVLVALSIDRLDAIARPMNFSGGNVRAKVLIALAWLSAGVFSIPMLVINKEVRRQDGSKTCRIVFGERWNWQLYMTIIATVLFVIPALIITTCYLIIIYVIWTKSKLLGAPAQSVRTPATNARLPWRRNTAEDDVRVRKRTLTEVTSVSSAGVIPKAKIRTIKMTFLIVLIFILCWSPYLVFDLLDVYGLIPEGQTRLMISFYVQSLAPLNSAANPVIYGFFSSRLCQNLRRLSCFKTLNHRHCRHHHHHDHPLNHWQRCCVCCCCCCCSPPQRSSTAHNRNTSFCLSTYALPSTTSYDHVVSVGPPAGAGPAGVDLKDSLCLSSRGRATTSNHRLQPRHDGGPSAETRTTSVNKKTVYVTTA